MPSHPQRPQYPARHDLFGLSPAGPEPAPAAGPDTPPVLLLRVEDVCAQLSLSRATVNRLIAAGVLPSVRLGRSRRVLYRELERFVADLAAGRLDPDARHLLGQGR